MLHTTHLFNNKSVNNEKEKKREAHLLSKTQQNSFDSAHTGFIASVDNMCTMPGSENPNTVTQCSWLLASRHPTGTAATIFFKNQKREENNNNRH